MLRAQSYRNNCKFRLILSLSCHPLVHTHPNLVSYISLPLGEPLIQCIFLLHPLDTLHTDTIDVGIDIDRTAHEKPPLEPFPCDIYSRIPTITFRFCNFFFIIFLYKYFQILLFTIYSTVTISNSHRLLRLP